MLGWASRVHRHFNGAISDATSDGTLTVGSKGKANA
jgi:hypothetical protein